MSHTKSSSFSKKPKEIRCSHHQKTWVKHNAVWTRAQLFQSQREAQRPKVLTHRWLEAWIHKRIWVFHKLLVASLIPPFTRKLCCRAGYSQSMRGLGFCVFPPRKLNKPSSLFVILMRRMEYLHPCRKTHHFYTKFRGCATVQRSSTCGCLYFFTSNKGNSIRKRKNSHNPDKSLHSKIQIKSKRNCASMFPRPAHPIPPSRRSQCV